MLDGYDGVFRLWIPAYQARAGGDGGHVRD